MQERSATGTRRAAVLRPALHAYAGDQLLRDAAGDGAGQRATGTAARNHEVHHGERGMPGARGDKRAAPDGRPEGENLEHFPYADEFAGKPRPF